MNKFKIVTSSALALLVATFSLGAAADSDNKAAEAAAQKNAAITSDMAITIAEQITGGKAEEAEFELEDGKAIYEVEIIMADGTELEVEIDAESGTVLSQKEEDEDEDDDDKDEANA